MAKITIDIPDAIAIRVLNSFTDATGWTPTVKENVNGDYTDVPNPETRAQYAKRKIVEYIKETVKSKEASVAAEAARRQAESDADSLVIS